LGHIQEFCKSLIDPNSVVGAVFVKFYPLVFTHCFNLKKST